MPENSRRIPAAHNNCCREKGGDELMSDPCAHCPIRLNCDWLSEMCRLTAREVIARPELIKPLTKHQKYYLANKDKYRVWNREASRRWRHADRQRRLEVERRYRATESYKRSRRAWREKNRDRINAGERRRTLAATA